MDDSVPITACFSDIFNYYSENISKRYTGFTEVDDGRPADLAYSPDVHNQVRSAYSHLMRAYAYVMGEDSVNVRESIVSKQIMKDFFKDAEDKPSADQVASGQVARLVQHEMDNAHGHIKRGAMDMEKTVYSDYAKQIEDVRFRYKDAAIATIRVDESTFVDKFYGAAAKASKSYSDGKVYESLGLSERARQCYHHANSYAADAMMVYKKAKKRLDESKANFERRRHDLSSDKRGGVFDFLLATSGIIFLIASSVCPTFDQFIDNIIRCLIDILTGGV